VRRIFGLDNADLGSAPHAVAVGAFDGVHLGHASILRQVRDEARERGVAAAVVTFDPVPRELEDGARQPHRRLTPVDEHLCLLEGLGMDIALVLEFPGAIQSMSPEAFVSEVLLDDLNAVCVYASESHRFGAGGRGDVDLLRRLGAELGFEVKIVPPLMVGGQRVSSTRVRELLSQGRVDKAAALLGRPYALYARVVAGHGRGADLGFPTANLCIPEEKTLPRDGVYAGVAGTVTTDYGPLERPWPAAINIGTAPTFARGERTVEVHICEAKAGASGAGGSAHADLLDACLKVEFLRWLRTERRFETERALADQIAQDVASALELAARAERRPSADSGG
jgi:riboflavin kinase/FMN adenylyltransferase